MKWAWEDDALRGEKIIEGSRNAARQTNVGHGEKCARRFARMDERGLGVVRSNKETVE